MTRSLLSLISVTVQIAFFLLPGGGVAVLGWQIYRRLRKKPVNCEQRT